MPLHVLDLSALSIIVRNTHGTTHPGKITYYPDYRAAAREGKQIESFCFCTFAAAASAAAAAFMAGLVA